jgi:hypothetical protein
MSADGAGTAGWLGWDSDEELGDNHEQIGGGRHAQPIDVVSHQLMPGEVEIHPKVKAFLKQNGGHGASDEGGSLAASEAEYALKKKMSLENWRHKTAQAQVLLTNDKLAAWRGTSMVVGATRLKRAVPPDQSTLSDADKSAQDLFTKVCDCDHVCEWRWPC